jgi:carbonic anhydrase
MMMPKSNFVTLVAVLVLTSSSIAREAPPATAPATLSPETSRQRLVDGHARYLEGGPTHPRVSQQRRIETVKQGQHPYAIFLSCADSRVPLELIFDAGIGDLFIVRVAGNVANTNEIGTIEYGVEHLHAPLVVVLGHTKCGAVTAVVDHAHVSENIGKLVAPIVPAVEAARKQNPGVQGAPLVAAAIQQNVHQSITDLLGRSQIVRDAVAAGSVKVIGGVYDLQTGDIEWLGNDAHSQPAHPREGSHGDVAGDHTDKKSEGHAPAGAKENFAALGALLGAAALVSTLAIRYLFGSRP